MTHSVREDQACLTLSLFIPSPHPPLPSTSNQVNPTSPEHFGKKGLPHGVLCALSHRSEQENFLSGQPEKKPFYTDSWAVFSVHGNSRWQGSQERWQWGQRCPNQSESVSQEAEPKEQGIPEGTGHTQGPGWWRNRDLRKRRAL